MRVIYCGELDLTPYAPDHRGIRSGLEGLAREGMIEDWTIVDPVLNSPSEVIGQIKEFNPDIIVHGNSDSLEHYIIPEIKKRLPKTKQVFWMLDFRPQDMQYDGWWKTWIFNSEGLDLILLSNYDQIKWWQKEFKVPVRFLPHGCYVQEPVFDKQYADIDLVFIGSRNESEPYRERVLLIDEIVQNLNISNVNFKWITETETDQRNKIWKEMPAIYHSAKLVLDISHFWDIKGYASGRYWYSAGLGGCCITRRFPMCEKFYQDKLHKWYFHDPIIAARLIIDLLSQPDLIKRTKLVAWEHNKKHHNYKIRFKQILKYVRELS